MLTLEQTIHRIDAIADESLASFAHQPELRYLQELPLLTEEMQQAPVMDCLENRYAIARWREVVTYKYLLGAMKEKQLAVSREVLATCLRAMRQSPVIDYYDLGDYHEMAFAYYQHMEEGKKARRHLLACYLNRGRAILSADKVFDSKDLLGELLKEHRRMKSLLLYVVNFICYDFEETQDYLSRTQYLFLERAILMAVKLIGENLDCAKELRGCVYHALAVYYEHTDRKHDAKVAHKEAQKLCGKRRFDQLLPRLLMKQPDPRWCDECFIDYMLYGPSIEEQDIYPTDDEGELDFSQEPEDPIVLKDGRENFMDTYFRPMPEAANFYKIYETADKGDAAARSEVARRYREGDGVTRCEAAAEAWEK